MTTTQPHSFHPKYRPDIDGLRAIAVLAVVIFHAFPDLMRGGFVGVDIFFVISGFLISTIIFENLDKGTFSFKEFYARRIRRIFPALTLVLAASYAFGWFALLADEYKQLGRHIAAGAGFLSNFVLWREAGYFDNSAETKPLLHLWSLGIEEQFYIVWPLLLWLVHRRHSNFLVVGVLVALLSFYLNIRGVKSDPVADFYSPQTRFWELMAGSIVAWITLYKPGILFRHIQSAATDGNRTGAIGQTASNILSCLGLILLVYGFRKINGDLAFPGGWAAIPVLGTMLIILAGPEAAPNRRLLSLRIAVWFGLISFPLYLWHWPLLSFARILEGEKPGMCVRLAVVLVSILFAWLTREIIEKRIRLGAHGKAKVVVLVVLMATIGGTGYDAYRRDGLVSRYDWLSPQYKSALLKIASVWRFRDYPPPEDSFVDPKVAFLRIGRNDKDVVLFIGDSHMTQYVNAVGRAHQRLGADKEIKPSVIFASPGFPPKSDAAWMFDPSVKTVVFSYYWALRYGSEGVNQAVRCCGDGKNGSVGKYTIPLLNAQQMDGMDAKLLALAKSFTAGGRRVYFVLDNPFGEENDPHSMLYRSWGGIRVQPPEPFSRAKALARTEPVRSRILRIADAAGARVIDPFDYLCDGTTCPAFSAEGELMYKDYDHLSLFASANKVSYLDIIFDRR